MAYPQGRRDAIATSASAVLRFMASCPGFVDQLMGELMCNIMVLSIFALQRHPLPVVRLPLALLSCHTLMSLCCSGSGSLQQFIDALLTSTDSQAAYIRSV